MYKILRQGIFPFSLAFIAFNVSAQEPGDSTSKRVLAFLAGQFAVARPFNVEYTGVLPYKYSPTFGNNKFPEARMNQFSQLKASANFNFVQKRKWIMGITAAYRYTDLSATMKSLTGPEIREVNNDFHYFSGSLNLTYFSGLFNKTVIYSSSLIADGSEESFGRMKGIVSAIMVLRADAKVKMSVGALINIDGGSQLPALPLFIYENKLGRGWTADIIFPRQFLIRKYLPKHSRLSMGTTLDATIFYLNDLGTYAAQKFEYRQTDISNGFIYERLLGSHFILTARTGLRVTTNGRIFEKNKSFNDAVFEISPKPGFYFNVGVSFNSFFKKNGR